VQVIAEAIREIMSESEVCEMRATIKVIVCVLITFRNARERPVEMLEESFR
jgi:hypothetical protein